MRLTGNSRSRGKERRNEPVRVSGKRKGRVTKPEGAESRPADRKEEGAGPQSQRERRVGTPEAGRKAGLDLQVRERTGLNSRGGKDEAAGSRDPRGRAVRPASRWRPRGAGRGAEGSGQAVLRHLRYICPQSTGSPHSPSSDHDFSSHQRDATSARVAPAMAL